MRCKTKAHHAFKLSAPKLFHQEPVSVENYYKKDIDKILSGKDDWFYPRTEVFTFLVCEFCGAEEHSYFPAAYLKEVIASPNQRFGFETTKKLQYTFPTGETITYDIELSTA